MDHECKAEFNGDGCWRRRRWGGGGGGREGEGEGRGRRARSILAGESNGKGRRNGRIKTFFILNLYLFQRQGLEKEGEEE